jgi:DNA-binding transcriptional regulator YiaG
MKPSEIIKKIRSELGITQEDFAHAISSTTTTVNRWENDKTTPNRMAKAMITDFCKRSGVSQEIIEAVGKIK